MEPVRSLPHSQFLPTVPILTQISPVHVLHPTSWRSILILSAHLHLGLPSGLFPSGFPTKTPVCTSPRSHMCYMPCPSHSSQFDHPSNIWRGVEIIKLPMLWFFYIPLLPHPSEAQIFSSVPYSHTPSAYVHPSLLLTMLNTQTKQQAKL